LQSESDANTCPAVNMQYGSNLEAESTDFAGFVSTLLSKRLHFTNLHKLKFPGVIMFTELRKLLTKRSLTITVAVLDDEQIRVNVVPHACLADSKVNEQIKYSNKCEVASVPEEAIKALTTPISITGTAEEIDAKFPALLSKYVESHVQLQETLDRASSEIAEAVKAIDERNKAKTKDKTAKKEGKSKSEEPKPKADDTLPLLWTDRTAAAPGTQPQHAPTVAVDAAKASSQTLLTQSSEVTQQ
jgi:PRTRC genetic system protein E